MVWKYKRSNYSKRALAGYAKTCKWLTLRVGKPHPPRFPPSLDLLVARMNEHAEDLCDAREELREAADTYWVCSKEYDELRREWEEAAGPKKDVGPMAGTSDEHQVNEF